MDVLEFGLQFNYFINYTKKLLLPVSRTIYLMQHNMRILIT